MHLYTHMHVLNNLLFTWVPSLHRYISFQTETWSIVWVIYRITCVCYVSCTFILALIWKVPTIYACTSSPLQLRKEPLSSIIPHTTIGFNTMLNHWFSQKFKLIRNKKNGITSLTPLIVTHFAMSPKNLKSLNWVYQNSNKLQCHPSVRIFR